MLLADQVPAGTNFQKSLQQALNLKLLWGVEDPPLHIGQVLTLPGAASLVVDARITLTVTVVVDTEYWITYDLLFFLDRRCIAKMQS